MSGRRASDPLHRTRLAVERAALPRPATVVVAMSGGPDSAALGLTLCRVAPQLDLRVVAAHYDHGLRAAASRAEERTVVRRQAAVLGLELVEGAAPPGHLQRRRQVSGRSVEELAREQRYAFLLAVLAKRRAHCLAVGHHLDDDLETILMRALQGSLHGGGIPFRSGVVLRPLLHVRRATLRAYVAAAGLPVLEDPTNCDRRLLRNRIRGVLPALEAAVPGMAGNLPALAQAAAGGWHRVLEEAQREVPWRYGYDRARGVHYTVRAVSFWGAAPLVRQAALYRVYDAVSSAGVSGRHGRPRLPRRFLRTLLGAPPAHGRLQLSGHGVSITCGPVLVCVARQPRQAVRPAGPAASGCLRPPQSLS